MDTPNQTKILLESGTNELEIMEFTVGGELFGINIAKIREIMRAQETKRMPNSHNFVEGIFKQRGEVITVIDLAKCLNIERTENKSHDIFILTHFNKLNFAFRVESVVGIDRVSWEDIKKPDKVIYSGEDSVATAIAEYKDRLITILDFEKIIADISPETSITLDRLDELGDRVESQKKILVAEDSMMLSNLIIGFLHKSGYKNTVKFNNGKEAWNYLTEAKESGLPISNYVSCIVSDIEIKREKSTYTIDTLKVLKQIYKNAEIYFITGADAICDIETWKDVEGNFKLANFIAATRPGISLLRANEKIKELKDKYNANIESVYVPSLDISSTYIREQLNKHKTIRYLVPELVQEYIYNKKLYSSGE